MAIKNAASEKKTHKYVYVHVASDRFQDTQNETRKQRQKDKKKSA